MNLPSSRNMRRVSWEAEQTEKLEGVFFRSSLFARSVQIANRDTSYESDGETVERTTRPSLASVTSPIARNGSFEISHWCLDGSTWWFLSTCNLNDHYHCYSDGKIDWFSFQAKVVGLVGPYYHFILTSLVNQPCLMIFSWWEIRFRMYRLWNGAIFCTR